LDKIFNHSKTKNSDGRGKNLTRACPERGTKKRELKRTSNRRGKAKKHLYIKEERGAPYPNGTGPTGKKQKMNKLKKPLP